MNTGILTNPAPDNGYNAIMGALAPHSAPAEGTLAGTTPSVHNRVKQTFINPVATYPFIAAPWRNERWELSFHPGDLMFIFTGSKAQHKSKSVIMANLAVLNHIMTQDAKTDYADFMNRDEWAFVGVMRNSAMASNQQSRPSHCQGSSRLRAERIINVDVRGATRMFNYWANAHAGAHLFLVWKLVDFTGPIHTKTVTANDSRGMKRPLSDELEQAAYWQLLPYTAHDSSDDKIWWNKSQKVLGDSYSRPICVGFVYNSLGAGEVSSDHIAIRKATQMDNERFKLPMIHTFLNV